MTQWYQDLESYMNELEIIDTHEHLPPSESLRFQSTDLFHEYLHYFVDDLKNAGMTKSDIQQLNNQSLSILQRWDIAVPYWEKCRHVGYGQVLDATVRILYGIPAINRDTVETIDQKIKESLKQDHYRKVLKDTCHIKTSILHINGFIDAAMSADREYFRPAAQIDSYINFQTYNDISDPYTVFHKQTLDYGKEILSLKDFTDACQCRMFAMAEEGAVAFKTVMAYSRGLTCEKATFAEAEKDFNRFLDEYTGRAPKTGGPWPSLENYMIHLILSVIEKIKLPLQIHTGLLSGDGGMLINSNPEALNTLFLEYPNVKFDIFHMGYPYQHVVGGLAKMFPNVYIDMCWTHAISPPACIHSLGEWLETVPYNKILGFGGDYASVDCVAGHRYLAIKNIAKVLACKINDGLFRKEQACQIATALLHDNAAELFGIV